MSSKKNLLFLRIDDAIQQKALSDFFKVHRGDVGEVINISSEDVPDPSRFSTDAYTYMNLKQFHSMELTPSRGKVIDAELLDALAEDEHVIIKMLERAHFKRTRYRYHDIRNHLYYVQLSFWLDFLTEHEVDQVIFGNVPHDGYDYIVYVLARHLGIKVDMFYQFQVLDSYIHTHQVHELFSPVKQILPEIGNLAQEDLSERMQREFLSRSEKEAPIYMKRTARHGKAGDAILGFLRNTVFRTERRRLIQHEIRRPALASCTEPDLNQRFIYFGLHVQPELTTNALGGRYVNQFLAIQLMARCLPEDMHLYVKEHPNMLKTRDPSGRFREFYQMVQGLEHVTLVPPEMNTFELIDKATAVATITGTVGWEAVFQAKPVVVFGDAFYKFCPGVFSVYSEEDMRKAIEEINAWTVSKKEARVQALRYLEALDQVAVRGCINSAYLGRSMNPDMSWHAHAFENELKRVILSDG